MALSTDISLEDLVSQFRGLNLNEPETWPIAPRILFMIVAALLVVALGWQFYWSGKFDERDAKRSEQEQLKSAYQSKLAQVINLEALRQQKVEVERRVAKLELQLPNKTEMDALLADVNHAGIARGLTFDLFRPASAVVKPYYAEIPVAVKVNGRYHDMALFAADVAALSRIVTLQDMSLTGTKDGSMVMEARAEAYRALDPDEQAAQRKAAAASKGGAK
ncbi:type 4a pilus biogenesis protein PilO [uncultured Ralstonia sp.]|mgnify:CR=1 FL=1|jgi:type IV pilus assembly protein PilO|uniref:type 4a pilus biogenesis protein PilO n=1 Tax=Ralstonia sp. TaxID=54061 RepID=UPI0025FBD84D|nr:type 4a pilus biogenesis protein PilO [uncultured Ralstonia sp.]